MNQLKQLAMQKIKGDLEIAASELVGESCAKEKGNITQSGNPLFNASHYLSDAQRWLSALIESESA